MNRAVKCRIEPNKGQIALFSKTFGCCRFLYNRMLTDRLTAEITGEYVRTTPAMYKKDYPWLKEVDSLALCNAKLHLDAAFRKYRTENGIDHPRYKAKHHSRQSYTTNLVNNNIRLEGKKLRLPKVGPVRIRVHREIPEE